MIDPLRHRILGDDFQAVEVALEPEQAVRAEPGSMMFMEHGIEMDTSTGGGLLQGLKRKLGGESFFITTFTNRGARTAHVAFAADNPGKILSVDLGRGDILCQRSAYLCSTTGIDVSVAFTRRLGAGFFGGEGFVLQRLRGEGLAFISAGGTIVERELERGERLRVDTGCVVGFEATVDYDIQVVSGVKTMLFGGEGLFFATLEGPGRVWIQTLPISRFADRILAATRSAVGEKRRGGALSKTLGDFLQGDR